MQRKGLASRCRGFAAPRKGLAPRREASAPRRKALAPRRITRPEHTPERAGRRLMSTKPAPSTVGKGAPDLDLSPAELRDIVEQALLTVGPGARVLAIVPDKTRDDNTDILFPFAADILKDRGAEQFDALVAQGTHMPMTEEEKRPKLGLDAGSPLP